MSRPRSPFIDYLQYVGLRVVSMLLHCWPVNLNLQTARLLGDLIFRLDRKHRQRAIFNITRGFPELTAAQVEALARRSMQNLIMFFVEVLFVTRLLRIDTWNRYVRLVNFRPVLDMLLRRQHGLILLTGHYGNFEVSNYVVATLGFETHAIGRPLDNPYVNDWLMDVRQRQGTRVIAKKGMTVEVTAVLADNGAVCFVADQNAGPKGMFVDFFGRKASTYKSIGLLAMEFGVPVVIGFSRRRNDRFEFEVGCQEIIWPADWANETDPLRYITQRYTKAIEDFVRTDPGQYWWVHRRWKSRPKGELPEKYD
jgi:Kdo2-lipid IVA lauroyltransferase/acyltransferase